MRRKPTLAMLEADEKRIGKARHALDTAFNRALVGCPSEMGCGTWIRSHAMSDLRAAYDNALAILDVAEQAAIDRGTMYRGIFGIMTPIRWK